MNTHSVATSYSSLATYILIYSALSRHLQLHVQSHLLTNSGKQSILEHSVTLLVNISSVYVICHASSQKLFYHVSSNAICRRVEEVPRKITYDEIAINEESENEEYAQNDENTEDEPDEDRDDEAAEKDGELPIFVEDTASDGEESENEGKQSFEVGGIYFIGQPFPERRRFRNVVIERSRTLATPEAEKETFELFLSADIIRTVQCCTNRKVFDIGREARNTYGFMATFTFEEIETCIGIIIYARADHDNFTEINDLWDKIKGKPLYEAALSINRFQLFFRTIRFDNYRTRADRFHHDKFAAVSKIWKCFSLICIDFTNRQILSLLMNSYWVIEVKFQVAPTCLPSPESMTLKYFGFVKLIAVLL